jgi:hypothetical protein
MFFEVYIVSGALLSPVQLHSLLGQLCFAGKKIGLRKVKC